MENLKKNLQKFKKPDKDFLKDKDCLICLETVDLEIGKFEELVKLPCECANSAYHIGCILMMLNSGQNKNFCPHCKAVYQIFDPIPDPIPPILMPLNLPNIAAENAIQTRKFIHIMLFHLLSNSVMNVVNISIFVSYPEYNINIEQKALMPFYFLKLALNYIFLSYSKNDLQRIESGLICSYAFQTMLFGLLIYTLTKMDNDYRSGLLILNNIMCVAMDIGFRIYMERGLMNRVDAEN
jgi:hypothetical protein